ncbi:hypothetical protein MRB53_027208 [Persea americana]|uniref:Uncharacterized protein n=1 Tax=Persea americana TaxID=3435 RepID=A0ACC2LLA9_PERAE|nr:hypothetical protein MRB53_027208 [Persea americana]
MVRERRHQQALELLLPPPPYPILGPEFFPCYPLPVLLPPFESGSPRIERLSDLEKLAVLGHGNGGTVYKVRHRQSSAVYALKVLRFDRDATALRERAAHEAEILKRVDSPFVVRCHGVFDGHCGDLCFVMEYMDVGSLHDVLRVRRRMAEKVVAGVARRVLEGLRYLHGMRIVHRDVKPSNLLVNGQGEMKISDFGVSRVVGVGSKDPICMDDSYVGTCAYMSPERLDPDSCGDGYDGFAGDVWALGVVLMECHVGRFPLISAGQRPDWATLMWAICFGDPLMEVGETASPEFESFVGRCLEKDWRRRGSVLELLNHPFVNWCSSTEGPDDDLHGWDK